MTNKKTPITKMSVQYSAYLENIVSLNSSFDKGLLSIAYTGDNRNGSHIDSETFEKATSTLPYVPVAANYNIEEDQIGSHDSVYRRDSSGKLKEYNLTEPLGLVPETPHWFWQDKTEKDGRINRYFCCEVLLWKRQAVYDHVKKNGVTDQSMEISVNDYEMVDGICHIKDFEFQAFTLLESAKPCYESACLETFSTSEFKESLNDMLNDFKHYCAEFSAEYQNTIKDTKKKEENNLNKEKLIQQYGFDPKTLDFEYEKLDESDLVEKLEAMKLDKFLLNTNIGEAMSEAFKDEIIETEYGSYSRYWIADYDLDLKEVYAYDREDDYKLFGFSFSIEGDAISIDFESKKRKKYSIVDFEGDDSADTDFSLLDVVEPVIEKTKFETKKEAKIEFNETIASLREKVKEFETLESEVKVLRAFKTDKAAEEKKAILDSFSDKLKGAQEYEDLYKNSDEFTKDELKSKCFEIIGKGAVNGKFSYTPPEKHSYGKRISTPPVETEKPYGDLFDDLTID